MKICGIDEAGRGPVIGPMVIVGVTIKKGDEEKLINLGVKDSKKLTKKEREKIFSSILKIIKNYKYYIVSPFEIDYYVYRGKLNLLEIKYFIKIINDLDPDIVYLDSPSKNTKKIKEIIEKETNKQIIAENKADEKYPIVSAASIIAKVIRDKEIEKIKKETGIDFGSGYPSDPKTIEALKKYYDVLEKYIRKSWRTVRKSKQKNISDFL